MKNDKKYVYAAFDEKDEKKVSMLLYGLIGDGSVDEDGDRSIDANAFAAEMFNLHRAGYEITVRINSQGGNVLLGYSIMDAIRETGANTHAVGMAASMGGAILQSGKRRIMNDYASIMIHAPRGGENQLLEMINAQLKKILSSKSTLSAEVLDGIFTSGVDMWYGVNGVTDDRNALKLGLVDEVIDTGATISADLIKNEKDPAKLVAVFNSILNDAKPKKHEMEFLQLKALLGLGASASESEAIAAFNKALVDAKTPLATEVTALKQTLEQMTNAEVDKVVAMAKEIGYPEDSIEALKTIAKADLKSANSVVNAFAGAKKITPIAGLAGSGQAPAANAGALKKYGDYMATAEGEKEFYALSGDDQTKVLNTI
jgi:ATP-dependent protease ClpP protease subunit